MSKLTLSVDDRVVARAKRYARQQGISVSAMVESYLAALTAHSPGAPGGAPVLRKLRGSLKSGNREEYRRHLAAKYR